MTTHPTPPIAQTPQDGAQDRSGAMLRSWMVSDGECMILCRAPTRGKARMLWPTYSRYDLPENFLALRVTRQPWLDGAGPARVIDEVWQPCEEPTDFDGYCANPDHWNCVEGEYVDRAATAARANGE